ncbi:MAG: hypothetical protein NTV02_00290 [Candidatus Zambryskibacteria bacterium]|nr:hypothetical protein [Candidatus Zambryskibacteria bacterium]
MESLKHNKKLVILLAISFIAFLAYQFGGVLMPKNNDFSVDTATEDTITKDILVLLNQMQQARIDGDLFTSTAWTTLVDYSIPLPSDVPGRADLFGVSLGSSGSNAPKIPVATTTVSR